MKFLVTLRDQGLIKTRVCTNAFYALIPHNFGSNKSHVINTIEIIDEIVQMIDFLRKMKINLNFKIDVEDIFKKIRVDKDGNLTVYLSISTIENCCNTAPDWRIFSEGLKIAPADVPVLTIWPFRETIPGLVMIELRHKTLGNHVNGFYTDCVHIFVGLSSISSISTIYFNTKDKLYFEINQHDGSNFNFALDWLLHSNVLIFRQCCTSNGTFFYHCSAVRHRHFAENMIRNVWLQYARIAQTRLDYKFKPFK